MNRKISYAIIACIIFITIKCANTSSDNNQKASSKKDTATASDEGIGRFANIQLSTPPDTQMAAQGQAIYNVKCLACHKLSSEKLVGPGWKGVTTRRKPEWIMNFITNTNVMLDSDLVAQQLMVTCLIRMPVQNLKDDEARNVLEFMRKNDSE
jgi:mono/diheme cytochrome c family protein